MKKVYIIISVLLALAFLLGFIAIKIESDKLQLSNDHTKIQIHAQKIVEYRNPFDYNVLYHDKISDLQRIPNGLILNSSFFMVNAEYDFKKVFYTIQFEYDQNDELQVVDVEYFLADYRDLIGQ